MAPTKLKRVLLLCVVLHVFPASAQVSVSLTTTCNDPDSISFILTNHARKPLRLPQSAIPWKHGSSTIFYQAFVAAEGRTEKATIHSMVGDYLGHATLQPGQPLRGKIGLQYLIGDYEKLRDSGDLVLLYRLNPNAKAFVGGQGMILIPRHRMFSTPCPVAIPSWKPG